MSKLDFNQLDEMDRLTETEEEKTAKKETKRRKVTDKFKVEDNEVEVAPVKKARGPKAIIPMQTTSFNFEKSVADAIDDYCNEHMIKKSVFVRDILKERMEELGYEFPLDSLKEGTFKK